MIFLPPHSRGLVSIDHVSVYIPTLGDLNVKGMDKLCPGERTPECCKKMKKQSYE